MDSLVSQQQLLYRDQSRPGSSASTSSNPLDQLAYPSLVFQQNFQQHPPHHHQQQPRKNSPTSSLLQISTANSATEDQDADEQTAHPSRMQPQFPAPQHHQQIAKNPTSDSSSIKSSAIPGLNRPLNHREQELLAHLDRLKFFLATAPSRWNSEEADSSDSSTIPIGHPSSAHPALNRFLLPNSEYVSCVLWGGLYHITGTDIVRALVFRFEAFGRPVRNMKKFEEGVFSDLRNLKPGNDACLEEPKSPFLDLLFKYQCIRTQKKQKVFYWFSVPHDRLFLDALERDLKREKMGMEPTTVITGEPALSFTYDPKRSLYEQFCKAQGGYEGEGELEAAVRRAEEISGEGDEDKSSDNASSTDEPSFKKPTILDNPNTPFASMFSLFEGSPTYKQRRKKTTKKGSTDSTGRSSSMDEGSGQYSTTGLVRDTNRMTAADLFMAQARGELASIGLNERSTHPRAVSMQAVQHNQNFHARGRLESRSTYPTPPQGYTAQHNSHRPQLFHGHAASLPGDWPYLDPSQNPDASMMSDGTSGRTKAFVCPLFSCGRMFKRMEHLKRHLRTHTMERPYQCQRCSKKFSRSDNLHQHIRIHMRMDAESASGASGFMNGIVDESLFDDGVNADVEDTEELDGDDAPFLTDVGMCEVEVAGNIHDVPGDEEGLVTTDPASYVPGEVVIAGHPEGYYPDAANANNTSQYPLSTSPEPAPYSSETSPGVQWMARSAPSPAFSSASMPSPQSRMSSAGPIASYNSMGEYISVSAPSHKATFDHGSMYPAHVHSLSGGPGPVRRHRSVTPSVARYGESIRRPYSAAMSDIPPPNTRSYHPYAAAAAAANSHSSSAQSSPGSYNAPLDYGSTMSGQMPVTIARSGSEHGSRPGSSHLQDHMSRMLSLDSIDAESMGYASEPVGNGYNGGMYRTDSPGTFTSANFMVNTNESQLNHPSVVDGQSMYAIHSQAQYGNTSAGHAFYGQPQSVPM